MAPEKYLYPGKRLLHWGGCELNLNLLCMSIRDVIFRKMTNQNQTNTNKMATTETKYQTNFYSAKNTNIIPRFCEDIA